MTRAEARPCESFSLHHFGQDEGAIGAEQPASSQSPPLPGSAPGAVRVTKQYLAAGELGFGGEELQLSTLLGSCVSVTLWHRELRLGGMCHGLMPSRGPQTSQPLDGTFTDEAVELLVRTLCRRGAAPESLEAKVFGGGKQLACQNPATETHIGQQNVEAARVRLERRGIRVLIDDVLGCFYRAITFDIGSGQVWVRRHSSKKPSPGWSNR